MKTTFKLLVLSCLISAVGLVYAAPPVVNTVPVDPSNPLTPHDIISGKATTLKGAVDEASIGSTWTWNPGDGSAPVSGTVDANPIGPTQLDDPGYTPYWALWIEHTYSGSDGDLFVSTLTVDNGVDAPVSATYRVQIRTQTLPVEVNVAIDEALWFQHRNQFRFDGTVTGAAGGTIPMGRWDYPQTFGQAEVTVSAASVNGFEANGYFENGPASSPYTDTVARGLKYLIAKLGTRSITPQPAGNPDTNGNGIGIGVIGTSHITLDDHATYKMGMVMDAIVASNTPGAVATTGPANVINRTYGDIIQDMVDYYAFSQGDSGGFGNKRGGWDYGPNAAGDAVFSGLDNSAQGWAAIGLLAAEGIFGSTIPAFVKSENQIALEASDTEGGPNDGVHGYRSTSPLWGPYATTSAALVQMALDEIHATTSATPDERWIRTENFFRRNFNSIGGGSSSASQFKSYYYAMFNFAKAMREAFPAPVEVIGTNTSVGQGVGGLAPIDWYNHPTDGLARRIVDLQETSGVNIGQFMNTPGGSSSQDDHETPWGTQILTRTLFQAGPVAVAAASPNPAAEGTNIQFDGSGSFHQDPGQNIVQWDWDFDDDGVFDDSGEMVTHSFTCPGGVLPCSFPVTLKVTDDNTPALTDTDIVVIDITIPPHPPTADSDGSYFVCTGEDLILDGSGSFDIDEGLSETGNPPLDTITSYEWDLDLSSGAPFDSIDANGENPNVGGFFTSTGTFDIGLRVTDNTAAAFPTSGQSDLTDTDFTTVTVADCSCMGPISIRPKSTKLQLTWAPVGGAATYTILRSTAGPNSGFSVVAANHSTSIALYLDTGLTNGITYWYRVTPKDASGVEICGGSEAASGVPAARRRR